MTIGIYALIFKGTHKVYVGKSKDIESRYKQHLYRFSKNEKDTKVQRAYNIYGIPSIIILEECSIDCLDKLEIFRIIQQDSLEDGFNSTKGGDGGTVTEGENSIFSLYKKEDYFCVLYYLGFIGYTHSKISEILNVSQSVVEHISSGDSHKWLEKEFPIEYAKLRILRSKKDCSAQYLGITYPDIKSPSGEIFKVTNTRAFAKTHSISSQGNLYMVLTGKRKSCNGWTLA